MTALCCSTLSFLDQHMSEQLKTTTRVTRDSHVSIVSHVGILRHTLLAANATEASLDHITFSLLQGLSTSACAWNITSLAWLMFKDLPAIRCALRGSMAISYGATSPQVSFPTFASLHSLECSCREVCSSLHLTSTYLQVSIVVHYYNIIPPSIIHRRRQLRSSMSIFRWSGHPGVLKC